MKFLAGLVIGASFGIGIGHAVALVMVGLVANRQRSKSYRP